MAEDKKATPAKGATRKKATASGRKKAVGSTAGKASASRRKAATPRKRASKSTAGPSAKSPRKAAPRTRRKAAPAGRATRAPAVRVAKDRVAIVAGKRSPFTKSWTTLNDVNPVELSTQVARETLYSVDLDLRTVQEVIWGTVITVPTAPNMGREVALNLGMYRVPGYNVSRACASGFQSAALGADMIELGRADIVLAGGVDVVSHAPVTYKKRLVDQLQKVQRAKGVALVQTIARINPLDLLPSAPALTERYTGLTMGEHAELMAQNFHIARKDQEELAIRSHAAAHEATEQGLIADGLITVLSPRGPVSEDNLIRPDMDPAKLARLRPVFDRKNGTITAATSSPLTDGAACVLLMRESRAGELGIEPLGFIRSYHFAALDPRENMLLGNVYSVPGALERAGVALGDLDYIEIHEAFAAQVLSNIQCMASKEFCAATLGLSGAVGEVDPDKLNIWGGSMAFGHPFAATGGRMIRQLLDILRVRDGELGIATACAAGGMGTAMVLERN